MRPRILNRTRRDRAELARLWRGPALLLAQLPRLAYTGATDPGSLPARVRELLVDLGPAYAKLGQVLSTRIDALPPAWTAELAILRDGMPAEPREAVAAALSHAFPDGVDTVFEDLSPDPIAAGTVAQVHTARLRSGERVAVKVLRPGVEEELRANFELLLGLATVAQRVSRSARILNVHGLVTELRELLMSQTNLEHEARNYRRFAREFADDDTVSIPRVFGSLARPGVLVTEFVDGIDPYETHRLAQDPGTLARRVDDLMDSMIFVKGLCHADLHPGNFFWSADARIVLVDLGLVHRLTKEERNHLLAFYFAVLDGFHDFAAAYLLRHLTAVTAGPSEEIPPGAFADMRQAVRTHWEESGGKPAFAAMFADLLRVLGRNGLQLRHNYSRLFLSLATVEGYLYSIDPGFDMLENARRKRVEGAEYLGIPPAVDELVFQGFGTYSTAMFGTGTDPQQAYADRDRFVLDALGVGEGTAFVDVGCGRGRLLVAAAERGAKPLGITISRAEHVACAEQGLDTVLSSWEDVDAHLGPDTPRFGAMAAIEMDVHLATLHENRVGLLDLRLERFFRWARSRLTDDGKLFVQTLSVPDRLLHDPQHAAEYDRLTDAAPWIGFSTLPQMIRCSDPDFSVEQVLDHSSDLLPTFAFWRDNITRQLPEIRELVRDETIVLVRRQLDILIGLAERERLQLYRILLRARAATP